MGWAEGSGDDRDTGHCGQEEGAAAESAELAAARELVRQAKEQGLSLTGPDGLLKQLTKTVLEAALDEELTEHLGHERRAPASGWERPQRDPVQDGADRSNRSCRHRRPS